MTTEQILATKKKWQKTERDRTARALREIHNSLIKKEPASKGELSIPLVVILTIIICGIILLMSIPAHAYTDEQIVNAIYKAEGGSHAQYPYGIRSITCSTKDECRRVCLTTVRHNHQRYAKANKLKYPTYLTFLQSRYCPIGAGNDSSGVNKNWLKNVTYFLSKEVSNG